MTKSKRKPRDCGGVPKQNGTGGGVGNQGTPRQPKKKPKK